METNQGEPIQSEPIQSEPVGAYPIGFTTTDFMQLTPIFIAVFMLTTSLFNQDFKGFMWLVAIVASMAFIMFSYVILAGQSKKDGTCDLKGMHNVIPLFSNYKNLSLSSFFIVFTLSYLMLPMIYNDNVNYYAIFGFLLLYGLDAYTKVQHFCVTNLGVFLGSILGILFAIAWYAILTVTSGSAFIYYNTNSSNNVYCSRPKKQQFKCNVYKNGEMISSL